VLVAAAVAPGPAVEVKAGKVSAKEREVAVAAAEGAHVRQKKRAAQKMTICRRKLEPQLKHCSNRVCVCCGSAQTVLRCTKGCTLFSKAPTKAARVLVLVLALAMVLVLVWEGGRWRPLWIQRQWHACL